MKKKVIIISSIVASLLIVGGISFFALNNKPTNISTDIEEDVSVDSDDKEETNSSIKKALR